MATSSSSTKYDFDLLVLGGGSGGVRASRISASHGAKVGLIELADHHGPPTYSAIGGTCVNVGCVPKKIMVYGSRFSSEMENATGFGWSGINKPAIKWQELMAKKDQEISRLNGIYGRMLGNAGKDAGGSVELLYGYGRFKDEHTLTIAKDNSPEALKNVKEVTAEKVIICVGGWPYRPAIEGVEHTIDSNQAFYLKERPDKVLVVGGGYIAVEFAAIFQGMGSDVTLMYRRDLFLRGFDNSCREHLRDELKDRIHLEFNTNPSKIVKQADGTLDVTTEDGRTFVGFNQVMYATGRIPKTDDIGLNNIPNLKLGKSQEILVNQYNQTSVDNIFAIGDVTNRVQLTPVALREGHYLADNLFGKIGNGGLRGASQDRSQWKVVDYEYIASAVFCTPEIGTIGYTEEAAAKKFKDITIYLSTFRPMMHTITGKQSKSLIKVIVDDRTDRVVGVHIVGENAGEMIQGVGIAVTMGAKKSDFDRTVGVHPSSLEEICTMRTPSYHYKDGSKL